MKKKFRLWLNIVTICLCIAAIAVGVYAAKQATLTVSGTIGFTAHGCKVNVTGYIYGHAQGANENEMKNGQPTPAPTVGDASTYVYLTEDNEPQEVSGQDNTLSLGTRYFTDMASVTGEPEDIYVVLQISNASTNYYVQAEVPEQTLTFGKITATVESETTAILDTAGTEVDFIFKLELQPDEVGGNHYSNITSLQSVNINMTFTKCDAPAPQDGEYYIDSETKMLAVNMGHGTEIDKATDVSLPWIAFAVKGDYDGTTATAPTGLGLTDSSYHIIVDNNTEATTDDEAWYSLNGIEMTLDKAMGKNLTFWFIQKYTTAGYYTLPDGDDSEAIMFNENVNDGNVYADGETKSNIYNYVTGDYLTDIGVTTEGTSAKTYYDTITIRNVNELYEAVTEYGNYSQTCSFSAKLWLINVAELSLLNGSEIDLYSQEDITYPEPVKAFGIGYPDDVEGYGSCWWGRAPDYLDESGCYAMRIEGPGQLYVPSVDYPGGIRAAFQVEIN